jgi:hypothetical protein
VFENADVIKIHERVVAWTQISSQVMTSSDNLTSKPPPKKIFSLNIVMNSPRENKNVNTMHSIVKMCDFSVLFFSLMRENALLEYLHNILEQVLYNLCNKPQAIKIFYTQSRSDRTPFLETKL